MINSKDVTKKAAEMISVADKTDTKQICICIHNKTGEFSVYKDRLDSYNDDVYFVFRKAYHNETQLYDMSDCKIYKSDAYNFRKISRIDIDSRNNEKYISNIKNLSEIYNVSASSSKKDYSKPCTELTARELICAVLKNPCSGTKWIDDLIRETNIVNERQKQQYT